MKKIRNTFFCVKFFEKIQKKVQFVQFGLKKGRKSMQSEQEKTYEQAQDL